MINPLSDSCCGCLCVLDLGIDALVLVWYSWTARHAPIGLSVSGVRVEDTGTFSSQVERSVSGDNIEDTGSWDAVPREKYRL